MIENLALGLISLLGSPTGPFFERVFTLPAGTIEITSQQPWNAVTLFSKTGEKLPEILYFNGETFVDWHPAEIDVDYTDHAHTDNALDLVFFSDPQDRLLLQVSAPTEVVGHFFNTRLKHENLVAQFGEVSREFLESDVSAASLKSGKNPPKFFTRKDWGADESLRVQNFFQRILQPTDRRWFSKEIQAVEPSYRPIPRQTKTEDGKSLFWPISENPKIAKFIIHHTGEAINNENRYRRNPKEIMRAIYSYHTVTRGWGDIGYNYIIDKQGNIYEGRAGGPRSLGAHTAYHNVGSIGISLMGNFEYERPTEKQIEVLSFLLADHARRFSVNPTERSFFLGKNSHNITGHRHVARLGHGTACPGRHLVARLDEIRTKAHEYMAILDQFEKDGKRTTRDFLQKSTNAQKHLKDTRFKRVEKVGPIELAAIPETTVLARGKSTFVELSVKNNTDEIWPQGATMKIQNLPEGLIASQFRATEAIGRGLTGTFRGKILAKDVPYGEYFLEAWPSFLEQSHFKSQIAKNTLEFPLKISGGNTVDLTNFPIQSGNFVKKAVNPFDKYKAQSITRPTEPNIKIKIAGFTKKYAEIESNRAFEVWEGDKKIADIPAQQELQLFLVENPGRDTIQVKTIQKTYEVRDITLKNGPDGVFTIKNYWHPQYGYGRIKYNSFRGDFHVYPSNAEQLILVNELPLEEYLWGIGEEPSNEPEAKREAVLILARSYGLVYSQQKRKFGTNRYDLEDDPATSQLYLGYDWERYHNTQKNLLKKSKGRVIVHNNKPVIGPYFTQSAGESSAKWQHVYPWTKAQKLPYDEGLEPKGHLVGLSGNSARTLAKLGKNYQEILDYFFDGIKVQKRY